MEVRAPRWEQRYAAHRRGRWLEIYSAPPPLSVPPIQIDGLCYLVRAWHFWEERPFSISRGEGMTGLTSFQGGKKEVASARAAALSVVGRGTRAVIRADNGFLCD